MSRPKKHLFMQKISIILSTTLLLCYGIQSSADIYKWVDENGNTHYSDIKPNQTNSETLKIKTSKSIKPPQNPQEASQQLEERSQTELESKAQKLKEDTQKRELQAQCEAIRNNLRTIEENSRIKITENNETRFLTQEEIAEKKAKYQQDLQEFCMDQ